MSLKPAVETASTTTDLAEAIRLRDWPRAAALADGLPEAADDQSWQLAAEVHLQQQDWAKAAIDLSHVRQVDDSIALRLNLCRNMALLKEKRPSVFAILAAVTPPSAFRIQATSAGFKTLAFTNDSGHTQLLSPTPNPADSVNKTMEQLQPSMQQGKTLALLGVGDGYMFDAVVRQTPTLLLGRRPAIYLIEPNVAQLFACLMLHDLTGADGPIAAEFTMWYVGPTWFEDLSESMRRERFLPFPHVTVRQGLSAAIIEPSLPKLLMQIQERDAAVERDVNRYYDGLPADHFQAIFSPKPPRTPRALLVTTRYSTVLQYSTRDAAEALRELGWDVVIGMETANHHLLTRAGLRSLIGEHKPDLILQIDHNRAEYDNLYPAAIPFVNWIQDLLPNLMSPDVGRRIGGRDYLLTPSLQRWVDEYAYPASHCLEFRKLTRLPNRPRSWTSCDEQVVYVSNWSQTPQRIQDELTGSRSGQDREVINRACDRMVAIYAQGDCLPSSGDCRRVLESVMREMSVAAGENIVRHASMQLFDRMNNLLYRQQGLRWAARACKELGLELQIYGSGWERHPEFWRYAKGKIDYGSDLENLTRTAGVNLVLEPFASIAHQRLLDAISAGGFCLIREQPSNAALKEIVERLSAVPASVATAADLIEHTPVLERASLQELLDRVGAADASGTGVDHIANVRRLQKSGFVPTSGDVLPMLPAVSFNSVARLEELLLRASRDVQWRADIARVQRRTVVERYSYTAGMRTMLDFVHQRLSAETREKAIAA